MAKKTIVREVEDVREGWGNLTTDEKVEKLKNIFTEFALRSGESDLLESITDGDPSFKLTK